MDGLDATSTAYAVGYESVSQFSREYSLFFDQPPIRDINVLRDSNVTQANVAAKVLLGLPGQTSPHITRISSLYTRLLGHPEVSSASESQ